MTERPLKYPAGFRVVWDNHACMPLRTEATLLDELERYRSAGVSIVSLNVGFGDMPWSEHVRIASFMRRWLSQRPARFCLPSSVEEVLACRTSSRLGIVFDVEGMTPVVEDSSRVQALYDLGVRWMLVAYNRSNAAGGGCLDEDRGLTEAGRTVIDEMARVGMVLCLSHTGGRTAAECIEYSRNPTIFSHSNPYDDTPHVRNVPDALMCACARKGGVVGLSGFGPHLGNGASAVESLLRQLRHAIDRVGADHVGLGLDYVFDLEELDHFVGRDPALFPALEGGSTRLSMVPPEAMGEIAESLARSNLSEGQIRGVLGENWLRIAAQVWR